MPPRFLYAKPETPETDCCQIITNSVNCFYNKNNLIILMHLERGLLPDRLINLTKLYMQFISYFLSLNIK